MGLSDTGECSGECPMRKRELPEFLVLLKVSCLLKRRSGISDSITLSSSSFEASWDSTRCILVISDGNAGLVGLQLVIRTHLFMTLGKPTVLVYIICSSPRRGDDQQLWDSSLGRHPSEALVGKCMGGEAEESSRQY